MVPRILIILSLLISSFAWTNSHETKAAGILGFCTNSFISESDCPASLIKFPVYATNSSGKAIFNYKLDRGDLGDIDGDTARADIDEILELWENVSNIEFRKSGDGLLSFDVDHTNYFSVLTSPTTLSYSPVVFDDDGKLTEELFGQGSRSSVLGFAGPSVLSDDGDTILQSESVLNGYLFQIGILASNLSDVITEFKTTALHEYAHMFGIDHTQGGYIDDFNLAGIDPNVDLTKIPVMFPFSANDQIALHQDDIAAINLAYPKPSFVNSTGTIKGQLLNAGTGIEGANIIAYNVDDPDRMNVASASDVDGQGTGNFEIPGLEPGSYIIRFEGIDSRFTGGSSIGIHDPNTSLASGFYNGANGIVFTSSLDTGISEAETIDVSAGETIEDIVIDINPNGSSNLGLNPTFRLSGKATKRALKLNLFSNKKSFVTVKGIGKKVRTLKLSTNYPSLVRFVPSTIKVRNKSKRVRVVFSSAFTFSQFFPSFFVTGATIPLTVQDTKNGFTRAGQTFVLFN